MTTTPQGLIRAWIDTILDHDVIDVFAIFIPIYVTKPFSTLTLLVGLQEGHPASNKTQLQQYSNVFLYPV